MRNRLKDFAPKRKKIQDIWLLSYVDMMTLLAILFILFFSMAYFSQDNGKTKTIKALKKSLNGDEKSKTVEEQEQEMLIIKIQKLLGEKFIEKNLLVNTTQNMIAYTGFGTATQNPGGNLSVTKKNQTHQNDSDQAITITATENIIEIRFSQPVLFNTGEANIKPIGRKSLNQLGDVLANIKSPIIVEGHTDNIPIQTLEFPSNWHLSFERSYQIITYLIKQKKINPKRLTAIGYADNRPVSTNYTESGRSLNRRIEIKIILPSSKNIFQSNESIFLK